LLHSLKAAPLRIVKKGSKYDYKSMHALTQVLKHQKICGMTELATPSSQIDTSHARKRGYNQVVIAAP